MYDQTRDPLAGNLPTRDAPAIDGYMLAPAMLSDTADLATYGKSLRIKNGTSSAIVIVVTPLRAESDAAKLSFTVEAGDRETLAVAVRRVWSNGSTGLAAGLAAGTVECQIYTR